MDEMLLPQLDDGITLLNVEEGRGVPILQSLVLDRLLLHDGLAFWVDANGHATTATLAQIAPSQRLLNRIHVARGFTAYQHYGAVYDLTSAVNKSNQMSTTDAATAGRGEPSRDEDMSPHTPALIVAPAIDAQYRADDTLGETHEKTLQTRTLARLATYAEGYDVPVIVTRNERNERNEFTEPVATVAGHYLECEQTRMSPRVVGEDFETLVYPDDAGALTKYFGKVAGDDEFKIRGIEAWLRSTPPFIEIVQRDCLEQFGATRSPDTVLDCLQDAVKRLHAGTVPVEQLVEQNRVSKPLEGYTQNTQNVAALKRAREQDLAIHPGQDIEYVVVDDKKSSRERVALAH
jgi:hypothetical protein